MARSFLSVVALVAAAPVAAAQDRDPFEAAAEAEAVRARQLTQADRAERRVNDPFGFAGDGRAGEVRLPVGPVRAKGEGSAPWLIPAAAVAALAAYVVVRRRRRNPWSDLPGHQGLRR